MELLTGRIRDYAWGSRTALATLQGRPTPSAGPEAELWLGAHPGAPATLADGRSLDEAIAADPGTLLGDQVSGRYGRLPYLLKVLAAAEPLSLQAHPADDRAQQAYAAGHPSYVDGYAKPELMVALDGFDALCGFRDPARSAGVIESFGVEAVKPVVDALRTGTVAGRLRGAMELIMNWPAGERAKVIHSLVVSGRAGDDDAHQLVADLGSRYPSDPGVLAALLLNQVRLAPDEAVFMPAGNLHAYLYGTGVEIMKASDNVLRGGFTIKPVDVEELLAVLEYEVLAEPVLRPAPVEDGIVTWPVPVPDFALCKASVAGNVVTLPGAGPRIVLCVSGQVTARSGDRTLTIQAGQALFVPGGAPAVELSGTADVFQARVGDAP